MKQSRFIAIISLIACSILALAIILGVQLNNSIKKQEGEFGKEVMASLRQTSKSLEKIESYTKYQKLVNLKLKGKYRSLLRNEFMNVIRGDEILSVKDTTVIRQGRKEKFLILSGKTVDSITGLTAEHKVVARDISELSHIQDLNDVNIIQDSSQIGIALNDKLESRLLDKVNMVNDFLVEIFRENIYLGADTRVNPYLLDSLLKEELQKRKITTKFDFIVFENNEPVNFKVAPRNYNPQIIDETFKTQLFDEDLIDRNMEVGIVFPLKKSFILGEIWGIIGASIALMLLIVCAFYLTVNTLLQQKKLSVLKSDFVNNMTHELKTPISTISLACEALNDPDIPNDPTYVKMIDEENKRLGGLVESILQSAIIDRGELKLKKQAVDMSAVIQNSIAKSKLKVKDVNGIIDSDVEPNLLVTGDEIHLTNIILNLIDNSIKYSKENLIIKISAARQNGSVVIVLEDNGIGISREHLPRIFDKLYRVPTGNRHDVKGFGLGLTYVKAVVEEHEGEIIAKSKIDVETTFTIKLKANE